MYEVNTFFVIWYVILVMVLEDEPSYVAMGPGDGRNVQK